MSVTRVRFLLELWRRSSLNPPLVPRHDDSKTKDTVLPWALRRPDPPKDEPSPPRE